MSKKEREEKERNTVRELKNRENNLTREKSSAVATADNGNHGAASLHNTFGWSIAEAHEEVCLKRDSREERTAEGM